jgi:uncharacterized protein YecT (DUF1311 family)
MKKNRQFLFRTVNFIKMSIDIRNVYDRGQVHKHFAHPTCSVYMKKSLHQNIFTIIIMMIIMLGGREASAQSQATLNNQAESGYQKADRELNTVYQKILKEYSGQPQFLKNLKVAQRLWVQLRNAELAAKYPANGRYGSVQPMCESAYLEQLTIERTKFLKVWLTGTAEGDVCSGSVKSI